MKSKDSKHKKGKDKKTHGKKAILKGRACPCCKNHCPLTKPKCSKGKAVRAKKLKDARR